MFKKNLYLSACIAIYTVSSFASTEQGHAAAAPAHPAPAPAPAVDMMKHAAPQVAQAPATTQGAPAHQAQAAQPMQAMPVQPAANVKIITTADLKKHIAEKKLDVIIDARGKDSFEKEHIKGAINIPYDTAHAGISEALGKAAPGKSPKDVHVVTYCQSPACPASAMLAKKLEEMGYAHVHELPAGIEGWIKDGGEIESSVPAVGLATPGATMAVPQPQQAVPAPMPMPQAAVPAMAAPQPGAPMPPAAPAHATK